VSESPLQREAPSRPTSFKWLVWVVALFILAGASYITYGVLDKAVSVSADGKHLKLHTFAKTVGAVLDEQKISIRSEDVVEPGLAEPTKDGLSVTVTRAFPVTLVVGSEELKVRTVTHTVAEVLRNNKVGLRNQDKVFPAPSTPVKPDTLIRVIRIDERLVKEQVSVPYTVRRTRDSRLDLGKSKVVTDGAPGLLERTLRIKVVNGHDAGRELVSTRVIKPATTRVVAVGTRLPANTLVTTRGTYTYRRIHRMVATAYVGGGRPTSARYASGYGVVAVDPNVIPMHSKLYIEGYGYAVAGDIGGAIKGNRIDLGYGNYGAAMRYGRREVKVYVLER
jgi:3D (Asp-Asp-Asp) domain-containing protein